jgi:hypothetical protein
MAHELLRECIEACYECAAACDHCAVACLAEPDPKPMARCVALDVDCGDICRLAAAFMSRGSELHMTTCEACAEACEACGAECDRFEMEHCKACAAACKRCAEECRRMVREMGSKAGRSSTRHAAH